MSYLQRLKNNNMSHTSTAKTAQSTIDHLFAVNAVPTLSIFEKIETPSYSFCSDHPKHISENEITAQEVKEIAQRTIDGLHPCPLCGGNLLSPGLDGCFHRSTLSDEPEPL